MKKSAPTATKRLAKTRSGFNTVSIGADYTEDELDFMKAVDAYKRNNGRSFPTWREILALLKSLGYRKEKHGND